MARHIDLDARRKTALKEATSDRVTITLGGNSFTLPAELPLTFAYYMQELDMLKAAAALVGPDKAEAFLAANPTTEDFEAIVEVYGVDLGESSGSPKSSVSTGKRSKQTSSATTKSTSDEPASAK